MVFQDYALFPHLRVRDNVAFGLRNQNKAQSRSRVNDLIDLVDWIAPRRSPGRLVLDAVLARDYPVIQGLILFFSFIYILINLLIDLSYTFFDPRIRY